MAGCPMGHGGGGRRHNHVELIQCALQAPMTPIHAPLFRFRLRARGMCRSVFPFGMLVLCSRKVARVS